MMIPQFRPDLQNDIIVIFRTGGWSSYFLASCEKEDIENSLPLFIERANRLIPNEIKKLPGNDKVKTITIYRRETHFRLEEEVQDE